MKVTKTYRRYVPDAAFGIVSSGQSKISYLNKHGDSNLCASGAGHSVIIWNLKTSQMMHVMHRKEGPEPVTCLAVSCSNISHGCKVAIGFADGWVHVFDYDIGASFSELDVHFRAGRGRITCMDFDFDILVCAADSNINVLDVVSGSGSKLKGHRGSITRLKLIRDGSLVISSAQDSFIKFWDVKSSHCFVTLTGHSGPVWDFSVTPDAGLLVSGAGDSQLRLWKLTYRDRPSDNSSENTSPDLHEYQCGLDAEFIGCVPRHGSRRVHNLSFDSTGEFLLCQSFQRTLEVFRLLNEVERTKRLKKKIKKAKDKGENHNNIVLEATDLLRPVFRPCLSAQPTSCDVLAATPVWKNSAITHIKLKFLCALKDNSIEELQAILPLGISSKSKSIQVSSGNDAQGIRLMLLNRIESQGHRSPPIQCCLTSDTLGIFTLSRTEAKLWRRHSATCLATLTWNEHHEEPISSSLKGDDSEIGLPTKASAMALVPGDRHLLVGFESGHLLLFDVLSKSVIQTINDAHQGGVRGLTLSGDKKSLLSGGSDKRVNFYNFDLNLSESRFHSLYLVKARDPETVADQITCIAVSANNHLVCIGLVNLHVDVYLTDLFKRVHSLYGHAAPVTSLDISADSRLLITGSSDKTVRLWELQFGNCQRRFTSHPDPVTCVRFIPHTSLAVSCDMGGLIKQWDVSKLREVTTLKGHHGGITCLFTAATNADFVTRRTKSGERRNLRKKASKGDKSSEETDWEDSCGGLVVSSGLDFSIRLWVESDDLLILEEEAELAREAEESEELIRSEAVIPGAIPAEISETGVLGYPTQKTRDSADMLMEAIDIYDEECNRLQLIAEGKPVQPIHPLITARCGDESPERFLLSSLDALRAPATQLGGGGAGFEHALGAITTDHVRRLLPQLVSFLSRGYEVELVGRAIRHIVTLHFGLIVNSQPLRDVLEQSREAHSHELGSLKGMMGMNLAGLEYLQRQIEDREQIYLFKSIISKREQVRRRISKRSRLAMLMPG